jgi:SAM-dependent methyltransferase
MNHPAPAEFDAFAQDYAACCARGLAVSGESKDYFAQGRLAWLARWLEQQNVPAPRRVIDFGCGVGDVTQLIAERFPTAEVIGLDVSPGCIERARREPSSPRIRFELLDAYVSARAEPADWLHCNGVFHHVPPAERACAVAKMASLVRPGGYLGVFENNPWNPGTHWVMHRIPFDRGAKMLTPGALRKLLRADGIEIRETNFLFFFPRLLRVLRGLEHSLRRLPLGAQYAIVGQVPIR